MANRRMFSKDVTNSDEFLDMPLSSQALYFHLGINADDDGFIQPKGIMRLVQAKDDDLKVLEAKGFIIMFNGSVIVLTHWKLNNQIRADRKKDSIYKEHLEVLGIDNNGIYRVETKCQPNDNQMTTKCPHSIGKDSIVEVSIVEDRKVKDTCEETSLVNEEKKQINKTIPLIIEKFKEISPSLSYGNTTQRSACENLIKKFGEEKVLRLVDVVIKSQFQDKFCPRATTPYILWQKIGDFIVYFKGKDLTIKKVENICTY